ncbi:MAG: hypothetical protein FWD15_04615 [Alphaproteobacteria bacterium]|nr:hypothetical protein [Alphaproteobacteria bacterium]
MNTYKNRNELNDKIGYKECERDKARRCSHCGNVGDTIVHVKHKIEESGYNGIDGRHGAVEYTEAVNGLECVYMKALAEKSGIDFAVDANASCAKFSETMSGLVRSFSRKEYM